MAEMGHTDALMHMITNVSGSALGLDSPLIPVFAASSEQKGVV